MQNSGGDDLSDGAYESAGENEGAAGKSDGKDDEISMEETKQYEEFK